MFMTINKRYLYTNKLHMRKIYIVVLVMVIQKIMFICHLIFCFNYFTNFIKLENFNKIHKIYNYNI